MTTILPVILIAIIWTALVVLAFRDLIRFPLTLILVTLSSGLLSVAITNTAATHFAIDWYVAAFAGACASIPAAILTNLVVGKKLQKQSRLAGALIAIVLACSFTSLLFFATMTGPAIVSGISAIGIFLICVAGFVWLQAKRNGVSNRSD